MERPSECPKCGVSWDAHEPAEAMVKPADPSQFEIDYVTETETSWRCLSCSYTVDKC